MITVPHPCSRRPGGTVENCSLTGIISGAVIHEPPLAAGIRMARTEQARGYAPLIIMATDGVTNVSIPRWGSRIIDVPDPATDALQMAKIIATPKWGAIVANMAHVTQDGPADFMMGTQLMMRLTESARGIHVGFTHCSQQTIVKDMFKAQALLTEDFRETYGLPST